MIIQSISSGSLDDRPDSGAACPDTVTHAGGGKRDSLTKQQATTAGLPSTQTSKQEHMARKAQRATVLGNLLVQSMPCRLMFKQAEVK